MIRTRGMGAWVIAMWGVGVVAAAHGEDATSNTWRYVGSAAEVGSPSPVLRTLRLHEEIPEEVVVRVEPRAAKRAFGQWRYGSENSTRVVLMVDWRSRNDVDLYVDRNRDRAIEPDELVAGKGRERYFELPVEIVADWESTHTRRDVLVRISTTGTSLAIATSGFAEGPVEVGELRTVARLVDGDANGLFTDPRDRLWLDRNRDGQWDPISEQFPLLPVLRLGDERFAVRADRLGSRMTLERLEGEGTVRVNFARLAESARITQCQVILLSDDGSAYNLVDCEPTTLPAGRYSIGSVALQIREPNRETPWVWVFSSTGSHDERRWYTLPPDGALTLDPLGRFSFTLNVSSRDEGRRPGQAITVTPRLTTETGLLLNSSSIGVPEDTYQMTQDNMATLRLIDSHDKELSASQSGFS